MELNELYQDYIDGFLREHRLQDVLSPESLGLYARARKLHKRATFPDFLCSVPLGTQRTIKNLVNTWVDQNL